MSNNAIISPRRKIPRSDTGFHKAVGFYSQSMEVQVKTRKELSSSMDKQSTSIDSLTQTISSASAQSFPN